MAVGKVTALVAMGMLLGGSAPALADAPPPFIVKMNLIDAHGTQKSAGSILIEQTADGLDLSTNLTGLPPGEHGFHLHEHGSCAPALKDGTPTAGQSAGGHYDPAGTNAHKGPDGGGHKGDLPKLQVGANGTAKTTLQVRGLTFADVVGKALVIHEGGDNYSDTPKPLGGGGARIACGVVPAHP